MEPTISWTTVMLTVTRMLVCASMILQQGSCLRLLLSRSLRYPWKKNGEEYDPEDICCFGSFKLKSLSFSDLNKEYAVAQDVLDAYNEAVSKDSIFWLCVYRSYLGFSDDVDNLTFIRVPVGWLANQLEKRGISLGSWLNEYTVDKAEEIVKQALADGVLLDCPDKRSRTVLSQDSSLESRIRDAQSRTSEPSAKDSLPLKDSRTDFPPRQ